MTTNHEAAEQQPTPAPQPAPAEQRAPTDTAVGQIIREELDWPFWPVPRPL